MFEESILISASAQSWSHVIVPFIVYLCLCFSVDLVINLLSMSQWYIKRGFPTALGPVNGVKDIWLPNITLPPKF